MGVMTVKGVIPQTALGITSPHEHAFIDIRNQFAGSKIIGSVDWDGKVNREALTRLMYNPYCMRDNLILDDEAMCIAEMRHATENGLNTFVDATPANLGRDPAVLKRLSEHMGLNIVMGCGYYTFDMHPDFVETLDASALADGLIAELCDGIGETGVRPGIIGELGTSQVIHPHEEKVLLAAATAYHATGTPIMVHLYPWNNNGFKVLEILEKNGVPPERICLCHTDVMLDLPYILELLRRGAYVEFDNFGKEFTSNPAYGVFPTDDERLGVFYQLIDAGYLEKLLVSCDVCLKVLYIAYGGGGYAHVLTKIARKINEQRGDAARILNKVLVENPARYLNNLKLDIEVC